MGAATRHRREFLKANPRCAFCGGGVPATTIEHCPPRAMFQYRQWPEGFEFPSCEACNENSSDYDLLIAMLARMDPLEEKGNIDGRLHGYMMMANKQFPGLFKEMMVSANEARSKNRELGIQPAPGQTHQEVGVVKVPESLHDAAGSLASKLAKGIFYREAKAIFPSDGCLLFNWFTNEELVRNGKYVVFDLLKELDGKSPPLRRSGRYLNNQFEYKLSLSPEMNIFVVQARFGNAFGMVVFGSTIPGYLEDRLTQLREQSERKGPITVLQSSVLT